MLLVIDIGNTTTVIGVYEKENLKARFRVATDLKSTSDQLVATLFLSLIHISEPTRQCCTSRMPSSA